MPYGGVLSVKTNEALNNQHNKSSAEYAVYIASLIYKVQEKQVLNEDEQKEVDTWLQEAPNREKFRMLMDRSSVVTNMKELQTYDSEEATDIIFGRLGLLRKTAPRKINRVKQCLTAAAILLPAIAITYLITKKHTQQKITPAIEVADHKYDIQPGSNKAVLTLTNGATITLDNTQNGEIIRQGNTKVVKPASGQLTYATTTPENNGGEISYNTVTTPRGGQYMLTLSDGTKVWLNAASSIHFPVAFTQNERTVEITGEAYFEVVHDNKKPFSVMVKGMKIQDLGTHFNVMAYDDEENTNTTLLEGSVKIIAGKQSQLLQPGQQARLNNITGKMNLQPANGEDAVAWKNGRFEFDSEEIGQIMRSLSRWYNVDIIFEAGSAADTHFSGSISRSDNISRVLRILELGGAKFKIEGKKIIVLK